MSVRFNYRQVVGDFDKWCFSGMVGLEARLQWTEKRVGGVEQEQINTGSYQNAWNSQEGEGRTGPAKEDMEGGFYLIWERVGYV